MNCSKIISLIKRHIEDLEEIKVTDPDFYKYLCEGMEIDEGPRDIIERFSGYADRLEKLEQ